MIINTIITRTARTENIPKPIPALKIPAIAVHELTANDIRIRENRTMMYEFGLVLSRSF
jgi:hypothetical protein